MPSRPARLLLPLLFWGGLAAAPTQAQEGAFSTIPQHRIDLQEAVPALLDWLLRPAGTEAAPRTTPRGVVIPPQPAAPGEDKPAPGHDLGAEPQAAPALAPEAIISPEMETPPTATPELPPQPRPGRLGYAFGRPRVLAQQEIFGIAHGIALLARACALVPETAAASATAYSQWSSANQPRIEAAERELTRYYFEPPYDAVRRLHLVQALQLKTDLGLAIDGPELKAACATLPQALQKPRYDLEVLWQLRRDRERLRRATEVRETLAQCHQQAEPEQAEKLDAALARWEEANAPLEVAARRRLLADVGDAPETEPEVAKKLELWLDELRKAVRRRFAYARPDSPPPCAQLAEPDTLAGPGYALSRAFDEDKNK
ncbi:MAG TPA: hypothetical protein VJ548_14450 [Azospira sp.]|nr:hypothetical protein [Azospira sp.]